MILDLILALIGGAMSPGTALLHFLFSLVALLLVFPVHECAHGLTALAFGDDTAKRQGRISLNPLRHIDLIGFLCMLFIGFGWARPVQYDSRYFKRRRLGTVLTAAAGPLSNLLFCFLSCLLYVLFAFLSATQNSVLLSIPTLLFYYIALYNATFAVFNLIPFPPLDGSKILGEMLPYKSRYEYYNLERFSPIFFFALILILNRFNFIGVLSNGILHLFSAPVTSILGGLFG